MNGRDKISLTLLVMILSGVVAYYSGQIAITGQFGDRPTRVEMVAVVKNQKEEIKEVLKATQEQTQRQLDDIKNQQDRTYNEIQKINDNIKELIRRDNVRR